MRARVDRDREREYRRRADAVIERVQPSEVIGRVVTLKRAGREFSGLCPFHNEKSASFFINNQKRFYHCFGCGAHGDVIGFAQRQWNLTFVEALEQLESESGLQQLAALPPAARAELDEETRRARAAREQHTRAEQERKARTAQGIREATHGLTHGDPVDLYLRGRLLLPPCTYGVGNAGENGGWPPDLRFAPSLWHPYAQTRHPAMVAVIRGPDGTPWAVHQTFLVLADRGLWTKASFQEKGWSKLALGRFAREAPDGSDRTIGGCIRLGPPAPEMTGGEGIETSLSWMQIYRRSGLSFVSSNNMPNVDLPFACRDFLYGADKDPKRQGERWAWRAAERHGFARKVDVVVPRMPSLKCDGNDLVRVAAAMQGEVA